ncbi:MAG: cell division protein FtsH, partial [Solirubrobacteraceae bacterium]|nr:cell division protein FtsH [Solirubrobacteraceae bacterium]
PITIGERSAEVFLGASLQELGDVAQETLATIDAQTRRIVERAEERAAAALREHWQVLQAVASELAARETLGEDELAELLAPIAVAVEA